MMRALALLIVLSACNSAPERESSSGPSNLSDPGSRLVRLTSGSDATIYPDGITYYLGQLTSDASDTLWIGVDSVPGRITSLCCPGPAMPAPLCKTERQISPGSSRNDVLSRYGPPLDGSDDFQLLYPGASFLMDAGTVATVCIAPW
jgi:hypothetical protein